MLCSEKRNGHVRLALIGASGFVGKVILAEATRRNWDVVSIGRQSCDLYNVRQLNRYLRDASPDVLINAAGYTGKPNVDACEANKPACLAGNAVLPGIIAEVCDHLDLPWGHISSGCIYSGRPAAREFFCETDLPNFCFRSGHCSFYSGTKVLGEEVLSNAKNCYIWRLRIPFSNVDSGKNYLSKLMNYDRLLEATNSLSDINEFAAAALDCFERSVSFGTYHLTNPGSVKTSDVVGMILDAGLIRRDFKYFETERQFMQLAAKTPRSNCVLSSQKALDAGLQLSPVRDAIQRALSAWVPIAGAAARMAA